MTEIHLQQAVMKVLQKEIIPKLSLFKPGEMKFFMQDIPLSTDCEGDEMKYFPSCIVMLHGGEVKKAGEPQLTTVEIIVSINDESKDMAGYRSLMTVLQRIRDYFTEHTGIEDKFRLVYPIEWVFNENFLFPNFVGSVITAWHIPVMPYQSKYL